MAAEASRTVRRRRRRYRRLEVGGVGLMVAAVIVIVWPFHEATVTATARAPSGRTVPTSREARVRAATAADARRGATTALRDTIEAAGQAELRRVERRRTQARHDLQAADAVWHEVRSVPGAVDVGTLIAQRSAEIDELRRTAMGTPGSGAPDRIASQIAEKQQEVLDLRSLAQRLAVAATARARAGHRISRLDSAVARARRDIAGAATAPVVVQTSRSRRLRDLRVAIALLILGSGLVLALLMTRTARERRRATMLQAPRSARPTVGLTAPTRSDPTPRAEPDVIPITAIDLSAEEDSGAADRTPAPVGDNREPRTRPHSWPTRRRRGTVPTRRHPS